jgi:hypothetical protein
MAHRAFRCQLCGGGFFRPVVVPRADGSRYLTSFYECAGCSVVFIDPHAFNANEPGPPQSEGAKPAAAMPGLSLERYGRPVPPVEAADEAAAAPEPPPRR